MAGDPSYFKHFCIVLCDMRWKVFLDKRLEKLPFSDCRNYSNRRLYAKTANLSVEKDDQCYAMLSFYYTWRISYHIFVKFYKTGFVLYRSTENVNLNRKYEPIRGKRMSLAPLCSCFQKQHMFGHDDERNEPGSSLTIVFHNYKKLLYYLIMYYVKKIVYAKHG